MLNRKLVALVFLLASFSTSAEVFLQQNPIDWRLQNYIPGYVSIWFTGSSCTNGQLLMPTSATKDDSDRLWATVTTAKIANTQMFVFYDDSSSPNGCYISSFGLEK